MADIFIGYASEDRSRVKPLSEALEAQGWSVWWDWKSIPVGKTWRQAIEEGLEAARSVLVLWSRKSIRKDWVIEEADFAKERNILVPVIIDDVRPPIGFRQIQAASLIEWQGEVSHTGFRQIIQALTSILGSPEPKETREFIEPAEKALSESAETFKNAIGMNFVLIPAGNFMMGSNISPEEVVRKYGGEAEWFVYEHPQHKVTISEPFYLQATAVTQGQWEKIIGKNPSEFYKCGDNCPVETVSWKDTQKFIDKLNEMEGTYNFRYRLPTEAEWEYACRAGTTTEFSFGDDTDKLGKYAWFSDNSKKRTHRVGKKKPNPWGLYDMHGNVWEWVEDDWHRDYIGAPDDGRAWIYVPRGAYREMRGGGFYRRGADGCRSAVRSSGWPDNCDFVLGFRLAKSVALGS